MNVTTNKHVNRVACSVVFHVNYFCHSFKMFFLEFHVTVHPLLLHYLGFLRNTSITLYSVCFIFSPSLKGQFTQQFKSCHHLPTETIEGSH